MNAAERTQDATSELIALVDSSEVRQKDIADLVGVSQQTVSNWCHGRMPNRRNEAKLLVAIEAVKSRLTAMA